MFDHIIRKKVKESAQVGTNEKGQFLGDRVVREIF